ncbi:MAG: sensor histidine kinase, partial [Gemmatimonadetes bacterium]|nr:sensor histidine kinase [Gemmatimonadota bacterium]
ENRILVHTSEDHSQHTDPESDFFLGALLRSRVSHPYLEGGEWLIDLGAPIRDERRNVVAVLVLRSRIGSLMAITGDYSGLEDTGETVLGDRTGGGLRFLLPLRFSPEPSQVDPVSLSGEQSGAMLRATLGQAGWIRSQDYRGEPVVAAYRPVRQTGWGLVAKQDEAEIFAAVRDVRLRLFLVIVALLAAATAFVVPLVRSFVVPIRELERATERVVGGDLDAHVPEDSEDEAGRLARSFNRMVEQLKESRQELTRRNEEMGSFAHVVSHDLKAPLRAVATLAEWLKEDEGEKLGEEGRKNLDLMGERVRRMDALIDGLLRYSRIGRVSHREYPVDVETLVRSVVDELNPPEEIEVRVTSPMPTLKTDEVLLNLVFRNLLDNAVKHHPGPTGVVEVSCQEREDHWEFAVSDDGSGIDARHHDRVFGIFQRLGHEGEGVGTGIGLALVKKTVEEGKGRVWIESEGIPGQGTTIRFTWPRRKEDQR